MFRAACLGVVLLVCFVVPASAVPMDPDNPAKTAAQHLASESAVTLVTDQQTMHHIWSAGFGGAEMDIGYAISVDGQENIVVTGIFKDTIDFGGLPLT